jgi:hypothetical protein
MAAIAHELVELIPEQQQALHDYFCLTGRSDSQDWRTLSDQLL